MRGRAGHRDDRGRSPAAGRRPARPLALQRQIGNRAFAALVARQPPTFSGSVFLPGEENVGHAFKLEGTNILDGAGRTKRIVATIDAGGRFTLVGDKGSPLPGAAGGNVRDLVGQVAGSSWETSTPAAATGSSSAVTCSPESAMEEEYVSKNFSKINGSTEEEARQKARTIVTKAGHR